MTEDEWREEIYDLADQLVAAWTEIERLHDKLSSSPWQNLYDAIHAGGGDLDARHLAKVIVEKQAQIDDCQRRLDAQQAVADGYLRSSREKAFRAGYESGRGSAETWQDAYKHWLETS